VLTLGFSAHDLASTRFATSPLQEVVASIRVLKEPAEHIVHQPWLARVRPLLAESGLDLAPLADLVPMPSWYIPDFLTPPATTPVPDFAAQLATLRATAPSQVRADLDHLAGPPSDWISALRADPATGLDRLAEVIEAYWELAIGPHWPRIHALQQGDVLYRARRLADGGAARLFADLASIVRWRDGKLYIAHPRYSGSYSLDGKGLLLIPSVFVWPTVFSSTIPPWQPTLTYPARGVASLWEPGDRQTADALTAVLGRSRTLLLTELDSPASTTELAHRTNLAPGSVSEQLAALRAAGLVTAHRSGRFVLYARTGVAESLLMAPVEHGGARAGYSPVPDSADSS
jgi:DNA-binding transcriptional ArsR family regulator